MNKLNIIIPPSEAKPGSVSLRLLSKLNLITVYDLTSNCRTFKTVCLNDGGFKRKNIQLYNNYSYYNDK